MKVSRFNCFSVILVIVLFQTCKKIQSDKNMTVVFYNVENLYDYQNDPVVKDEEFLPQSSKVWDKKKYNKKLEDIAKVLSNINKNDFPELIGLCEIENKKVLTDLISTGRLAQKPYRIVHFDSPDERGIDCALLYRSDEIEIEYSEAIPVKVRGVNGFISRDILYVIFKAGNNEKFHLFVNHWPSRNEGQKITELKRIETARILKSKVDFLIEKNNKANIIIMGDMNDEPENRSLSSVLSAAKPDNGTVNLVNLMYVNELKDKGTIYFQGNYMMFDNMIVSRGLLDYEGFTCKEKKGFVFRESWMEFINPKGDKVPNRTYGGSTYFGGISDHFPVYFKLVY